MTVNYSRVTRHELRGDWTDELVAVHALQYGMLDIGIERPGAEIRLDARRDQQALIPRVAGCRPPRRRRARDTTR